MTVRLISLDAMLSQAIIIKWLLHDSQKFDLSDMKLTGSNNKTGYFTMNLLVLCYHNASFIESSIDIHFIHINKRKKMIIGSVRNWSAFSKCDRVKRITIECHSPCVCINLHKYKSFKLPRNDLEFRRVCCLKLISFTRNWRQFQLDRIADKSRISKICHFFKS